MMTMRDRQGRQGFSAVEILAVIGLVASLALLMGPSLVEILQSSRLRAAARQMASEVRLARSKSVATGWQYRITGISAGSSDSKSNQYRVMARESSAIGWPSISVAPSESATLIVGDWIDVGSRYAEVQLNQTDTGEFALAFDKGGTPIEMSLSFNPLQISGANGAAKFVTVSAVGSVRVD